MGGDSRWTLAIVGMTLVGVAALGLAYFRDTLRAEGEPAIRYEGVGRPTTVLTHYTPVRGEEADRAFRALEKAGFYLTEMRTAGEGRQPVSFLFLRRDSGLAASFATDRVQVLNAGIRLALTPGRAADVRTATGLMRQAFGQGGDGPAALWKILDAYVTLFDRREGDAKAAADDLAANSREVVRDLVVKGIAGDRLCLGLRVEAAAVWWRVEPLSPSTEAEARRPQVSLEAADAIPPEVVPFLLSDEEILRAAGRL